MKIQTTLFAGAALLLAGCDTLTGPPPPPPAAVTPTATVTLTTATKAPFGTYVTDGSGRSVYVLEGTRAGSGINRCAGVCLNVWPPVPSPSLPTAGSGLRPPAVRLISGYRGAQMSYSGWPLYYYHHDMAAGDTTGQGVHDQWGTWYLLSPDGEPIRPHY